MRFRPPRTDPPEINLIPFIDVLLVILIFLMLSTTYSKFTELQVTLPTADAQQLKDRPAEIIVAIAADGRYAIDRQAVEAFFSSPVTRVTQFNTSRRSGRQFVHLRLATDRIDALLERLPEESSDASP